MEKFSIGMQFLKNEEKKSVDFVSHAYILGKQLDAQLLNL